MANIDQRAALQACFDYHDARRESADDSIAAGEIHRDCRRAKGKFRDQRALGPNPLAQFAIARRVADVHARAHDRDRVPSCFERALVRRRIDTERHSRTDDETRLAQLPGEPFRMPSAIRAAAAAADHRNAGKMQAFQPPFHVQHRRWRGDFAQQGRVFRRFEMENGPIFGHGPTQIGAHTAAAMRRRGRRRQRRGLRFGEARFQQLRFRQSPYAAQGPQFAKRSRQHTRTERTMVH